MPELAEAEVGQADSPAAAASLPASRPELGVVVASTYTAEPIADAIRFWLDELGFRGSVEFEPYNQVVTRLLDPTGPLSRTDGTINFILSRAEDGARFRAGGWDHAAVLDHAEAVADALRTFAARSAVPTIVMAPPPSPSVLADPDRSAVVNRAEALIRSAVDSSESLHWLGREALSLGRPEDYHDEAGDRIGHMPYLPEAVAAMATAAARRIHAIKSPPFKVLALDCDNTLWRGVVGEDGPRGISLGPGMKALQEFVVAQQEAGMVACLVSKNAEADVLEAFDLRDDFPLRREHLVAWRIGWGLKSRALVELAEELNVGLDSFVFLDDNPVECAEVRASLPQVVTLQVPGDDEMVEFLRHAWPFDRLKVTEEDQKRTLMYRQNADRSRVESRATDIVAFLESLQIQIDIAPPSDDQWARVAQLTQRTNQFNFSTRRRSEADVRRLGESSLECLRVDVADRFGDYGLVGILIFGVVGDSMAVDTMLLSCRVLGRGVEHAMFAHLGQLAADRGIGTIEARFIPTAKNEPAGNFLRSIGAASAMPDGEATVYRVPAAEAAKLAYRPGADASSQLEFARTGGGKKKPAKGGAEKARDRSASYARIAGELSTPEGVIRAVERANTTGRGPSAGAPYQAPKTAVERELANLWRRILLVDRVGVIDEFEALGGNSLKAARLFVEIDRHFGVRLLMTTILESSTVEALARRVAEAGRGAGRDSLKRLRKGTEGGPALFLVHDGDGETLLYLNLARRLPADLTVFGIEPRGNDCCPTFHADLGAMAADYVARVVEAQPDGPYLLGGMCAGGTIAFEMAMRLRADGREVGLVALLDAADAQAKHRPFLQARRRWARFARSLGGGRSKPDEASDSDAATGDTHAEVAPKAGRLARVVGKVRNLVGYEVRKFLDARSVAARVRDLRAAVAHGGEPPEGFAGPSFRAVYDHSARRFEPIGLLDAPVLLIRAGGDGLGYESDEPHGIVFRDPLFGWGARVAGGPGSIEVVDVPGGHGGMLQEPHVASIATPLAAAIARRMSR